MTRPAQLTQRFCVGYWPLDQVFRGGVVLKLLRVYLDPVLYRIVAGRVIVSACVGIRIFGDNARVLHGSY